MTLFWTKQPRVCYGIADDPGQNAAQAPEYDEDGRRYVFRFAPVPPVKYNIDRDRLFSYLATHRIPGLFARRIRRDLRNAADFYEDVREIQTHADVLPLVKEQTEPLTRLRLRSA
jgi:hypothetical protein